MPWWNDKCSIFWTCYINEFVAVLRYEIWVNIIVFSCCLKLITKQYFLKFSSVNQFQRHWMYRLCWDVIVDQKFFSSWLIYFNVLVFWGYKRCLSSVIVYIVVFIFFFFVIPMLVFVYYSFKYYSQSIMLIYYLFSFLFTSIFAPWQPNILLPINDIKIT